MSVSVWITDGCNLQCKYCWQVEKRLSQTPHFMDYETWNQILDFLLKNYRKPSISFFGAEPLLNPQLFMDFVTIAVNRGICSFSVSSNGVNFGKKLMKFFRKYRIRLLVSYDGKDQIANRGVSSDLSRNLDYIREAYFMVLYTDYNPLNYLDNIISIWESGFDHIFDNIAKGRFSYRDHVFKDFEVQYDKVVELMLASQEKDSTYPKLYVYSVMALAQKFMPDRFSEKEPCEWYTNGLGIDVKGNIYPCHRGIELGLRYSVGNVFNEIDIKKVEMLRALPPRPDSFLNYCPVAYSLQNECDLSKSKIERHYEKIVKIKMRVVQKHLEPLWHLINRLEGGHETDNPHFPDEQVLPTIK